MKKIDYVKREDGRLERLCIHGIGHPVYVPKEVKKILRNSWKVHGCDGCCEKWK